MRIGPAGLFASAPGPDVAADVVFPQGVGSLAHGPRSVAYRTTLIRDVTEFSPWVMRTR
jgi:hypothetical protein